jgi:hypothetical protein
MLEKCLMAAQEIAAKRPADAEKYTGAASVKVEYNPYTGDWEAEANWSCGTKVNSIRLDPNLAAIDLDITLRQILRGT